MIALQALMLWGVYFNFIWRVSTLALEQKSPTQMPLRMNRGREKNILLFSAIFHLFHLFQIFHLFDEALVRDIVNLYLNFTVGKMQLTLSQSGRVNRMWQKQASRRGDVPWAGATIIESLLMVSTQEWELVFTDDFFSREYRKIKFCESSPDL